MTIVNSQFSGNLATTTGGAMYVAEQSALTILNSTFSGNLAGAMVHPVLLAPICVVGYCFASTSALLLSFTVKHCLSSCYYI